jgi:hypothetical protein
VFADCGGGGFGLDGVAGQVERDFEAGLPVSCGGLEMVDRALDPDDCGHMRLPFRFSDGRLRFEHGDGSGFVTITPILVDSPFARQGLGSRAEGFDRAAEGRLIILELDNQMGVGGASGFKRFF